MPELRFSIRFAVMPVSFGVLAGELVRRHTIVGDLSSLSAHGSLYALRPQIEASLTHPSTATVVAAGLAAALVLTLSILVHELGHALAAWMTGIGVARIELTARGGLVHYANPDRQTRGRAFLTTAAGPLATALLLLAGAATTRALGWSLVGFPDGDAPATLIAATALSALVLVNGEALIVNLLPIGSLDGRRLLRLAFA